LAVWACLLVQSALGLHTLWHHHDDEATHDHGSDCAVCAVLHAPAPPPEPPVPILFVQPGRVETGPTLPDPREREASVLPPVRGPPVRMSA